MPVSNEQLKERLSKILPPNKVAAVLRMVDREEYQSEEGEERLREHLEKLGIPSEGADQIVGITQERGEESAAAREKEWGSLVTDTPEEALAEAGGAAVMPDFSGIDFSQLDPSKMGAPAPEPAAAPEPSDPLEDRFGHDLAWLDDAFKEKQVTTQDALQYGTSADPETEARQKQAIGELFDIYQQGGMTAQDRAARAKNRADAENLMAGQNAATMQDMAERGMGGSGAELAAMLANQQGAAGRLSQADLQTSADSEARALQALMGGQQAASGLQGQQDQFVANNAAMLQKTAGSNAEWLRKGYTGMKEARDTWGLQTLLAKLGVAQGERDRDVGEQQYGYTHGTGVATGDAGAATTGQAASNAATLGTFTGMTDPIWGTTQTRIDKTGGTQAAAGRSASGGAQFVGNLVTSLYGGKGGGGGTTQQQKTG